jgi:hypothetical protein
MNLSTLHFALSILLMAPIHLFGESDYVERVDWGAYLEPGNRILHGAGQDPQGFKDYSDLFDDERKPLLLMTYIGLLHDVAVVQDWGAKLKATLEQIGDPAIIPQIGLELKGNDGTPGDDDVAAGLGDDNIDAFADAVEALGRPVFIRIGYEFEGSWNGYQPLTFKEAWIRITQKLRDRGLPVATVWCSAGGSAGWRSSDALLEYYPGDRFVDWFGIDIFSREEFGTRALGNFLDLANLHMKPVMIGESTPRYVGVLDGEADWEAWFRPYFDLLKARPEIKATAYINWEWDYWAKELGFSDVWVNWGDARLEKNTFVRENFLREMADPIYFHTRDYQSGPVTIHCEPDKMIINWEVPFSGPWKLCRSGDLTVWSYHSAPMAVEGCIESSITLDSDREYFRLHAY